MPKPKQFLKESKKKSKHAQQAPETADEYLAAGVDFEEAGEKWRGGDAAKSTRFFVRAIDCYDEALRKFPKSFDLAYNKARVQYELTQSPKLKDQLPGSLLDLLTTALESSRYALSLKEDNADVLFNTAQILTSLAQLTEETRTPTYDPLPLLEEALELFQRCLTLQEYQFTESQAQVEAISSGPPFDTSLPDPEEGGAPLAPPGSQQPEEEERWATILEPITHSTLLDTLLAQLQTLTTLSSLLPPAAAKSLSWIEEYSTPLLTLKLPTYLSAILPDREREHEAALVRANFISAVADANFRAGRIDGATYERSLEESFGILEVKDDPEGQVNKAEGLIAYNSALKGSQQAKRWKALSTALECLTAATKLPSVEDVAKIHLLRGDVELLRYQLGREGFEVAIKSQSVLIKNAEKFYRGAGAIAKDRQAKQEYMEAGLKEALAQALGGDSGRLAEQLANEEVRDVVEDAVDDGLVGIDELHGMGNS